MKPTKDRNVTNSTLLLTERQLREVLGVGARTARKIADDAGATIHIGKRVAFSFPKLREWLAQQTQ